MSTVCVHTKQVAVNCNVLVVKLFPEIKYFIRDITPSFESLTFLVPIWFTNNCILDLCSIEMQRRSNSDHYSRCISLEDAAV